MDTGQARSGWALPASDMEKYRPDIVLLEVQRLASALCNDPEHASPDESQSPRGGIPGDKLSA